jgi:hypothetical protein
VRYLGGVLCLGLAAMSWIGMATASPAPGMLFGLYPRRVFVLLVAISYVAIWAFCASLSRGRLSGALGNFILTTTALGVTVGLIELPALLGAVDYRRYVALPESVLFTRVKAWELPGNRLDPELLHLHRPGQTIRGDAAGDLVHWLQIPTERRYPIDIEYDSLGFRNDRDYLRAPIIVLGDSFAEAGLVAAEDLLPTRLARRLGVDIANLGQSGYGPQQELIVLKRYGLKLQPRIVLWLFFEGNDLLDIPRYERLSRTWEAEMHRAQSPSQRTLTRNVLNLLAALTDPSAPRDEMKARRRSCTVRAPGTNEPLLLYFAFAGEPLSEEDHASLQKSQEILLEADRHCADVGAELVLVFVPTKFRVYDDLCEFPDESLLRGWRVHDLPWQMAAWAAEQGILFLDLTGPLEESATRGELVFFPDDGHWNAKGNEVAAGVIAGYLEESGLRARLD